MGNALQEWRDKLEFLQKEEATAQGSAKFALRKEIEEAKKQIAEFEAAASLAMVSALKLPEIPDGFVGRESDLEKLRSVNPAAGALLTGLRGMGGIGKTALAIVLAHEWKARFPDAQLFLEARGSAETPPTAAELLAILIRAFQPQREEMPQETSALASLYRDILATKRALIVIDNAHDAAQVKPLIPPPGCALIVTSRHRFMLGTTVPHLVGQLPAEEAIALLREFYATLGDDEARELAVLCAGLPLALRIVGAHLAWDASERGGRADVSGYLAKLRGGRLAVLDADAPDAGEVTISETLRLSVERLTPPESAAWRQLSVFPASFDEAAAIAVTGAQSGVFDALVRRSLLEREGERYRLHDLARDFAAALLSESESTAAHFAHAGHYTSVAWKARCLYVEGDAVGGLALFDRERAQLETAYDWLVLRSDEASAWKMITLVNAVAYTGHLRFHPRQRIVWQESHLGAAHLVKHRQAEGNALSNLGIVYIELGDARRAIGYHEQALAVCREIGDRCGEGNSLNNLGIAHSELGDARRAIGYHEQALTVYREIGDHRGEGNALMNLGNAHNFSGDTQQAIEYHEQALPAFREISDQRGEGNVLGNLGSAYYSLGNKRRAIEYYEQALVIDREIGDLRGEATDLWNSALAHDELGNRNEAIARVETALRIFEAIEDPDALEVRATLAKWRGADA